MKTNMKTRWKIFVLAALVACIGFAGEADAFTLSFQNFTALNGVTVSGSAPYTARTGTRYDPDTVTLLVEPSASVLNFQLTVTASGFSGVNGSWCELDWDADYYNDRWDDDYLNVPRENVVTVSGGGFSVVQNFSLNPASLWLSNGGTRSVIYELDVDEEPYDSVRDPERYLVVTFVASGSNPTEPTYSTNPTYTTNPTYATNPSYAYPDAGSGCNVPGIGLAALVSLVFLRRTKRTK